MLHKRVVSPQTHSIDRSPIHIAFVVRECPGLPTVVSTERETDTQCRRLPVLPYQSISPRDKHLRLSWEQAAAAASVKEVHSRVSRCPEVEARALTLARVAALEIMTSVLFSRTQCCSHVLPVAQCTRVEGNQYAQKKAFILTRMHE